MISLIVATVDRVTELEQLLASLGRQSHKDFEVLVVDQNPDDRLAPVLERHRELTVRHLRSGRGLSRARNVGLAQASGGIIGFPDDDCWYPPQLLEQVKDAFDLHPEYAALFATLRDADHQAVGPKWPDHASVWSKENVWVYGVSAAGFVRREVTDAIGRFDENLGMGAATPYQSGEDVDYFVRPLELGWEIGYDPALTVHHPSFHRIDRVRERSYSYALGGGYTLRTHHYPLRMLMESLVRSMGGAVVSFFRGNFLMSQSYILRGAGVARGYFLGPSDLRKARLNTD